jgi:hypothetical protein
MEARGLAREGKEGTGGHRMIHVGEGRQRKRTAIVRAELCVKLSRSL